jgi:hypothetical protein
LEQLTQYLPYILNGAGGAVLAPLIAGLMGGKGLGSVPNILLGAAAGVGAGYGVQQFGYGDQLAKLLGGGGNPALGYLQDLIEGAVGGGVLGVLLSFIKGRS